MIGARQFVFVVFFAVLGHLPKNAVACGFPQSFNDLRVSMEEVVTFSNLLTNQRIGILQARLRNVDLDALDTSIDQMRLRHRAHEIQRLLFYARGLASGMARVDRDELETLLRRIDRIEASACRWTRALPGLSKPGSDVRLLWVVSLFVVLVWAARRVYPQIEAMLQQTKTCRISASLWLGSDRVEIELIELSKTGFCAVPETGGLDDWNLLLKSKTDPILKVSNTHVPCGPPHPQNDSVRFEFLQPLSGDVFAQILERSHTNPKPKTDRAA